MAFGKNLGGKRRDEPFETPHWDEITQFTVGRMMRNTLRRSKRGEGALAVRFRRTRAGDAYMVPGLYIVPVDPARPLSKGGFRLFEDEDGRRPVCTVLPDGPDRYQVTDADGRELGSVHRTPVTKRLTQQGLWMRQPGHPPVVAPRNWARGGLGASLERGAGHVVEGVVDSLLSFGSDEVAGSPSSSKPVVWAVVDTQGPEEPSAKGKSGQSDRESADSEGKSGQSDRESADSEGKSGEAVLTCPSTTQTYRWYFVKPDGWLDKRLAFALVVLRESEALGAAHR